MQEEYLKAEPRTQMGTRVSRKLRESGRLPVIIYGHGQNPEAVTIGIREVMLALTHGARMVKVELNKKTQPYLIKAVQYDHLDNLPLHLDLARVDLDERVTVSVSIELKGTPKGINEGGVLEHMMTEIEVDCLVTEIPGTLHPLVTELLVGDALLVKDLDIPSGVKPLSGLEEKVALVREALEEADSESDDEEASEMPEIIGRVRSDEPEKDKS